MPEKPEVITIAKNLKSKIIGKRITNIEIYYENMIVTPSVSLFKKNIKNQKIEDISTRGKWIIIYLTSYVLLIHLRMEGRFYFRNKEDKLSKHEHVVFTLDNNEEMRYHDTRKFGRMLLLNKVDFKEQEPLISLGYEYNDKNLTVTYLENKFKSKKIPIKTALLDQSIIAGIGNIYDDEILFLSHINPKTPSNKLTSKNLEDIIKNTKIVLDKAIKLGGSTIKSYEVEEGVHGRFQNELLVHTKNTCPICNSDIIKIKINGRGTYYCPKCQEEV